MFNNEALNKLCEQCAQAMVDSVHEDPTHILISPEQRRKHYLLQIEEFIVEQAQAIDHDFHVLLQALHSLTLSDPAHFSEELLKQAKSIEAPANEKEMHEQDDRSLQDVYCLSDATMEGFYRVADERFKEKSYGEAAAILRYLCVLNVEQPHYWLALGNAEYHDQKFETALEAYAMVCLIQPGNPYPQLYAAHCWENLGDLSKAQEAAQGALNVAQENPELTDELKVIKDYVEILKTKEKP